MREKSILKMLEDKENVLSKAMALKLEVSERTIRNEISMINKMKETNGFKIINTRGTGYKLIIENKKNFDNYKRSLQVVPENDFTLGVDERTNKILEIFLIKNKYITIDYLSEKMGYSRGTVIKDLKIVENKLKILNLKLDRKTSLGLKVEGEEIAIRKAISSYLYSSKRDFLLNDEVKFQVFGKIRKIFIEEILKNEIEISNVGIENIFYHLKILILRFSNESFIEEYTHKKCLDKRFENIAFKLCECVKNELKIDVPIEEKEYLAAQMFYKSNVVVQENYIKAKAQIDIEGILKKIDELSYTNFSEDDELKNNLLIHLCALINRVRTNTQLKNPYFDEVNTRYSAIVSIAVNFSGEFCKKWNMDLLKDEIAFIAIHFATHFEKARLKKLKDIKRIAVVCSSNGGMEYFIKIKLEEMFGNVIVDSYRVIDLEKLKQEEYDFVITTFELEEKINIPVFTIKNIFDETELEQIVKKVEKNIGEKNISSEKIDEIFFKKEKGGSNIKYKKFLRKEAQNLIGLNLVEEDFEELVISREEKLSTAYKNNIAAPHGLEMNARKNIISVTVFENNIQWEDKKVDIVILIAMKKKCLNLHTEIATKLFHLTNSEKDRERIRKCKEVEDFKKVFESI